MQWSSVSGDFMVKLLEVDVMGELNQNKDSWVECYLPMR
jgi:hypothetical protein